MGFREATEHSLPPEGQIDDDFPPVGVALATNHESALSETVDETDYRVVSEQQAPGKRPNGRPLALRQPFQREKDLVLLRLDSEGACPLLAEDQKETELMPEVRQRPVVDPSGAPRAARRRSFIHIVIRYIWTVRRPSMTSARSGAADTNRTMSDPVSDSVRRLITESIASVSELEAILLLREHREREWTLAEARERLYVGEPVVVHLFGTLVDRGFFTVREGRFRYAAPPDVDQTVRELAVAYGRHTIVVTNLIHQTSAARVLELAGAVRERRGE